VCVCGVLKARVRAHTQLARFIESSPDVMLGPAPTFERLPHVLYVIADALDTPRVDDAVQKSVRSVRGYDCRRGDDVCCASQFVDILRHMSATLPNDVLLAAWNTLSEELRSKLTSIK
jgi:hypothetical protein